MSHLLPAIAELLARGARAMRAHGITAAAAPVDDTTWELRVDDRPALTASTPADAPPASPVLIEAAGARTWTDAAHVADMIWPLVGAECRGHVRRVALAALAQHAAYRDGRVQRLHHLPPWGPWAGLVRVGHRVLAVARWDAGRGQRGEVRISVDSLTSQEIMRCLGVSLYDAQRIRERALEDAL